MQRRSVFNIKFLRIEFYRIRQDERDIEAERNSTTVIWLEKNMLSVVTILISGNNRL